MKLVSILIAVALASLIAVVWLASSEDETGATPTAAGPGVDAMRSAGSDGDTPLQQEWRQHAIPPEDVPDRTVEGATPRIAGARGEAAITVTTTGQPVARAGAEAGVAPDTISPPSPPPIDKAACEAAARTLSKSTAIFDVTPKEAIWYSKNSPPARPSAFYPLQERLLATLCTGVDPFDPAYPVESEFVAISDESYVRIFVGDHWISEGTVLSFLSEADQNFFGGSFLQGRRTGPGPNRPRNSFDRMLAKDPQSLITVP